MCSVPPPVSLRPDSGLWPPLTGPRDHTQTHHTPLASGHPDAENSTSQHNTHKRQTSMPPAGFEHPVPATERPQIHALDSAVTGTGVLHHIIHMKCKSGFITFLKCGLQYKRVPRLEAQFWL